MISIPGLIGRFLAAFALLIVLSGMLDMPRYYAAAMRSAAAVMSPLLTGWWLETRTNSASARVWLRRGNELMPLRISLEALAVAVIPFVSLTLATAQLGWRRRTSALLFGLTALFALHLLVIVLYPALVEPAPAPELVRDKEGALFLIAGQFLGLIAFVAAPVILWFLLTFDHLRSRWRLQ